MTQHTETPLIGLLTLVQLSLQDELHARLHAQGWPEARPSHGCVFGGMRPEGVRLTPKGQKVQDAARAVFAEIEAEWGERIGKKKVTELRSTLEELSLLPPLVLDRAA